MNDKSLLKVGVIVAPHGIKGYFAVQSFITPKTSLYDLEIQDRHGKSMAIKPAPYKINKYLIYKAAAVTNRNEAEKLRGTELFISPQNLPPAAEDEFYIYSLLGRPVFDATEQQVGIVSDVYDYGAEPIIAIRFLNDTVELFPFTTSIFPIVDAQRIIFSAPTII